MEVIREMLERSWLRMAHFLQHFDRINCALGRFLMLEICKHVTALPQVLTDAVHHGAPFVGRVGRFAVTVVAEVGGNYVGSGAFFSFRHSKRAVAALEQSKNLFREP